MADERQRACGANPRGGFSLLEVLVAMSVLALVLVLIMTATDQIRDIYAKSVSRARSFEAARTAYDVLTRRVASATLNTYLDYDNPASPSNYVRLSELHFVCGPANDILGSAPLAGGVPVGWGDALFFTAPTSFTERAENTKLNDLLNAVGFFVEFGDGRAEKPAILGNAVNTPERFRLVELLEPTESLRIYGYDPRQGLDPAKSDPPRKWILDALTADEGRHVRLVAENIVGFFLWPQTAQGEFLSDQSRVYDSRPPGALGSPQPDSAHQLPPVLRVVMVALDEASALRLEAGNPQAVMAEAFEGLFHNARTNADVDSDLAQLEARLALRKVQFRMFNSYVHLGEAKWNQ